MATPVPLREAAGLLGVSRQHVSRLVAAGELHPQVSPCGCRLFPVDELLVRRRNPPRRGPILKHENRPGAPVRATPMVESVPIDHVPIGPPATVRVMVMRPARITLGGQVIETFTVGPCMAEDHHARALVEAGVAEWPGE